MDPITAGLTGAGLLVAMALGYRYSKKFEAKMVACWTTVAENLGGKFVPAVKKFWSPEPPKILATLAPGVTVLVDQFTVSTGKSAVTYTRLTASAAGAGDMKLKLSSEGVMASVGKALGLGDLQIGDPVFDERFLVRTGDAERARAWLAAEEVRAALLASIPGYAFALEKGQLKAQRAMVETDPVVLTGIIRAVAALAGGGMTLHAAWAEIAKELGGTLGGEALLPGESRFEAEVHGRQLSVAITADGVTLERELGMRDAPAFSLEGAEPLASIPEAARLFGGPSSESDWQAVQPAKLTGAGAVVTLSWNGYRPERTRLVAAARLLAAVESGPYR